MISLSQTMLMLFVVFLADFLNNLGLLDAVMIGGMHIYIFDVISLMLLAFSFPYWISLRRKSVPELLLMGLFWFSIASFIAGFRETGLTAGVAYRQDFTVFALLFYMLASRQRISLRNLMWIIVMYSFFGLLEGFLRITGLVQQTSYVLHLGVSQSSFIAHRPISTNASLAMAGLFLILLTASIIGLFKGNRRVWTSFAGMVALALSVADMNRSVWLAAIGGLITVFLSSQWRGSFKGRVHYTSVLAVSLLSGAVIVWGMESHYLMQAASEMFKPNSTANWRMIGWMGLIDKVTGLNVLWGMGYGADQTRIIFGHAVKFSAHDLFVHYYFYMGLIGLMLYLALMYGIFKGLRRVRARAVSNETKGLAIALTALFVLLLLYHIAYDQWLLDAIVYAYSLRLMRQHGLQFRVGKMLAGQHAPRPLPQYVGALSDRPL